MEYIKIIYIIGLYCLTSLLLNSRGSDSYVTSLIKPHNFNSFAVTPTIMANIEGSESNLPNHGDQNLENFKEFAESMFRDASRKIEEMLDHSEDASLKDFYQRLFPNGIFSEFMKVFLFDVNTDTETKDVNYENVTKGVLPNKCFNRLNDFLNLIISENSTKV